MFKAPSIRMVTISLVIFLIISSTSCSSGGPALHPVTGKIMFQGQPTQGATVVFQLLDSAKPDSLKPTGVVQADGSFKLSTPPYGEGAPTGSYLVLVTWFPPNARGQENPQNKLPTRYGDPSQKLLKAEVKPGTNELPPFLLTK